MYLVFSLYCVTRDIYFHLPTTTLLFLCIHNYKVNTNPRLLKISHILFFPLNTFLPRLDLQEKFIPKGRYTGFLKPGVTFTKRFENLDLTSNFPFPQNYWKCYKHGNIFFTSALVRKLVYTYFNLFSFRCSLHVRLHQHRIFGTNSS